MCRGAKWCCMLRVVRVVLCCAVLCFVFRVSCFVFCVLCFEF